MKRCSLLAPTNRFTLNLRLDQDVKIIILNYSKEYRQFDLFLKMSTVQRKPFNHWSIGLGVRRAARTARLVARVPPCILDIF